MEKIDLLKNVSLFSKLGAAELAVVAEYSAYYDYREGETIFEEGTTREELYILNRGEVVISKKTDDGKTVDVARYIAGDCFGELSILNAKPRTGTATATGPTTLLIFPERSLSYRELLERHPAIFAQILHKLVAMIAGRIRSTNALISERSPWVEQLRRQLLSDELTGLYNRTFLEEDFKRQLSGYGDQSCVLMVKPDNFKLINDTYGHVAGDEVLKLLANTVKAVLRNSDIAVRYRGNEIAVILPGTDPGTAQEIGERIRTAISEIDTNPALGGTRIPVTASVGIAIYPENSTDSAALVELAFARMWEAREAGGNRTTQLSMERN